MKNVSLAINGILFVLIIVLFFMYSSLKKSINGDPGSSAASSAMTTSSGKERNIRIAYVNADSINGNYKLMRVFKDDIQQRQSAMQNEYEVKGKKLQEEYV